MKKTRVIKLNENDIERLVNKIMEETYTLNEIGVEPTFKRSDLKPGKAIISGTERLVILDGDNIVQAIGPDMSYLKNAGKDEICRIANILIGGVFDLEGESDLNETDHGDATDIEVINFCKR